MFLERLEVIDNADVVSLVKSEFDTVRNRQYPLNPAWGLPSGRFSLDCCGLVFDNTTCFASNGHWALKIRTAADTSLSDYRTLYYSYAADEICEDYNPYAAVCGVPLEGFYRTFLPWNAYVLKVRVADLVAIANSVAATIRTRRGMYLTIAPSADGAHVVYCVDNECVLATVASKPLIFPKLTLNLSYLTKIAAIYDNYFYLVDLCISNVVDDVILFKGKSRGEPKPDIRIALAQAKLENRV